MEYSRTDPTFEEFKNILPVDTKIINIIGTREKFEGIVRCRSKSKEEFLKNWLNPFEQLNRVGMRTSLTRPRSGKSVSYKAVYRCQHNTYPNSHHKRVKSAHKKHTDCPALIRVTIKALVENRRNRSQDKLRYEYPTVIVIIHNHNHILNDSITTNTIVPNGIMAVPNGIMPVPNGIMPVPNRLDVTTSHINLHRKPRIIKPIKQNLKKIDEIYEQNIVTLLPDNVTESNDNENLDLLSTNSQSQNINTVSYLDEFNDITSYKLNVIEDYNDEEFIHAEINNDRNSNCAQKNNATDKEWKNLKEKFFKLMEKWEENKSAEHFQALQVAFTYLRNLDDDYDNNVKGLSYPDLNSSDSSNNQNGIFIIQLPTRSNNSTNNI